MRTLVLGLGLVLSTVPADALRCRILLGKPPSQTAITRCVRHLKAYCRRFPGALLCGGSACDVRRLCEATPEELCESQGGGIVPRKPCK